MSFYAHTVDGQPEEHWERLLPHLEAVAERAGEFAGALVPDRPDLAAWGRAAGLLHDAGKYNPAFQAYLRYSHAEVSAGRDKPKPRVDHSTFGARVALERYGNPSPAGLLLAYGVAGHHAGLPDGGNAEPSMLGYRVGAKTRDGGKEGEAARPGFAAEAGGLLPDLPAPPKVGVAKDVGLFPAAMVGRMLFSCLTDADILATEGFTDPRAAGLRGGGPALAVLEAALDAHLAEKTAGLAEPDSPVNRLRAEVLAHCRAAAAGTPGVYSLAVPTGAGKTLSSLAFALKHARLNGMRRVVYVIPYLSIIEQTAQEFRDKVFKGIEGAVVEHHSAYVPPRDTAAAGEEGIGPDRHKLAAENWDAPVIVTTAVQLFESLYAARPSACRKLHNLAGAVIVLDEAQLLPVPHLRPCVEALKELARGYGATVLLCTATQPALREGQPLTFGFPEVREIVPPPGAAGAPVPLPPRVRVEAAGPLTDEALVERMRAVPAALCVVDRRAWAAGLFKALAPGTWDAAHGLGNEEFHHLSAAMCAAHRAHVVARIREDLKTGRPCRVVATQLVEAGVDLDFPLVLRAMAGLDSLAQAAGRANREGRLGPGGGRLTVFEPPIDPDHRRGELADLKRREAVAREMVALYGWDRILEPDVLAHYFRNLYAAAGEGTTADGRDPLDMCGAFRAFRDAGALTLLPYRTVAQRFQLIEDGQVEVIVPWGADEGERARIAGLIDELDRAERPGRIARLLQRHTVSVSPGLAARWRGAGMLREAGLLKQFLVADAGLYHPTLGLAPRDLMERTAEAMVN